MDNAFFFNVSNLCPRSCFFKGNFGGYAEKKLYPPYNSSTFIILAGGMTIEEILEDFPELTRDDIKACLAFAAERERKLFVAPIMAEGGKRLVGAIA
jgi:hypothetical protein